MSQNSELNEMIKNADDFLQGKFNHETSVFELKSGIIRKFDWNMKSGVSPTMQLAMHSLKAVKYLCVAYNATHKTEYMISAMRVIKSWTSYNKLTKHKNFYTWYNHSAAERAENIFLYMETVRNNASELGEKYEKHVRVLNKIITDHMNWLADDSNYAARNNHGILQDKALLLIANKMEDSSITKAWKQKAYDRLDDQLSYTVSENGVHLENSPKYQLFIYERLKKLMDELRDSGDSYYKKIYELLGKAEEYIIYMLQPDGSVLPVGDSFAVQNDGYENKAFYCNQSEYLRYLVTNGHEGKKPTETFKVFKEEGCAYMREHWELSETENCFYASFKSGMKTMAHKHKDDNSFTMFAFGREVFTDPGMFAYKEFHPIREYVLSNAAHNGIMVDNKNCSVSNTRMFMSGILDFGSADGYDWVVGHNEMYDGVQWDRWFYYIKPNAILIFDDILSKEEHEYTQVFHLAEGLRAENLSCEGADISVNSHKVSVRQFSNVEEAAQYFGDEGKIRSFVTRALDESVPTNTCAFTKHGKNVRFVTLITTDDKIGVFENDELRLSNGVTIPLKPRKRVEFLNFSSEKLENGKVRIEEAIDAPNGTVYSWTVYDAKTGKLKAEQLNLNEPVVIFDAADANEYIARLCVKTESETILKTVGLFTNNGTKIDVPDDRLMFRVKRKEKEQLSENKYRFILETEKMRDTDRLRASQWQIVDENKKIVKFNKNEQIEYEFPHPGMYSVYYIAKNMCGERLREQFESIII